MSIRSSIEALIRPSTVASAHCDLPCGVYDPAQARIEAESVKACQTRYQDAANFHGANQTLEEYRGRAIAILNALLGAWGVEADDDVVASGLHIVRTGLDFTVTAEDGTKAQGLEPYLGMAAHLIAVRVGDLAYVSADVINPVVKRLVSFGAARTATTVRYVLVRRS